MDKQVYNGLMTFGRLSGCHQLPERSFRIGQYQFPLCARCTGICIGYAIGALLFFVTCIPIPVCIGMAAIMYIDWKIQDIGLKSSTNMRRCITGILCGVGYLHFMVGVILMLLTCLLK